VSITALPTTYAGITFRSRLEADWAHTLDHHRIPWQYEPEGFHLTDGTKYLPDFYLPSVQGWLEIKGDHMDRYTKIGQFAADLWTESGARTTLDREAPLILLGQSPQRLIDIYQYDGEARYRTHMVGIMAAGKRYSVGIATCPECRASTIFALGQPYCRTCGARGENIADELRGDWLEHRLSQRSLFRRVPRPFQAGTR
jgi:hypothetical protein